MTTENAQVERLQSVFAYPMPYEWSIGLYGSRFFHEIMKNRRFIGIKCEGCGKVYVPPRRVCGPCFRELHELVPLSDTGVITAFSVDELPVHRPEHRVAATHPLHLRLHPARRGGQHLFPHHQRDGFEQDQSRHEGPGSLQGTGGDEGEHRGHQVF